MWRRLRRWKWGGGGGGCATDKDLPLPICFDAASVSILGRTSNKVMNEISFPRG